MPKRAKFSNPALKKKESRPIKKEDFNLAVNVNSFNAVFDLQKLDASEEVRLREILENNRIIDETNSEDIDEHFSKLKTITSEIKSISRQGAFLIGERVVQAKKLLKPYRDGTFTLWLESTFGSRKSGYNMLSYYELFNMLPTEDLKDKYKLMAQRAAYILANRKGELQRKIDIIDQHFSLKSGELIEIVQKEFAVRDFRAKKAMNSLVDKLLKTVDRLVQMKKDLSADHIHDIEYASERLANITQNSREEDKD